MRDYRDIRIAAQHRATPIKDAHTDAEREAILRATRDRIIRGAREEIGRLEAEWDADPEIKNLRRGVGSGRSEQTDEPHKLPPCVLRRANGYQAVVRRSVEGMEAAARGRIRGTVEQAEADIQALQEQALAKLLARAKESGQGDRESA